MSETDAFHAHLDACAQCRRNPFGLCSRGATLLQQAATQPVLSLLQRERVP